MRSGGISIFYRVICQRCFCKSFVNLQFLVKMAAIQEGNPHFMTYTLPAIVDKTKVIEICNGLCLNDLSGDWVAMVDPITLPYIDANILSSVSCQMDLCWDGEHSKSIQSFDELMKIYGGRLEKCDGVLVIGGGSLINMATFLCAALSKTNKNLSYCIVPTTYLSMVDVAYGSLGLLNDNGNKNKYRNSFDPTSIVIDRNFIRTLPLSEIKRGVSETLKHALLQDNGAHHMIYPTVNECLNFLKGNDVPLDKLMHLIHKTLQAKASVITAMNKGNSTIENILSYGHLDAEPREAASRLQLAHGDSVLLGLAIELALAKNYAAYTELINTIPFTPLAHQLSNINFDQELMKESYRSSCKKRFVVGGDVYRLIKLSHQGQFAELDNDVVIDFIEIGFEELFEQSRMVIIEAMDICTKQGLAHA